MSTIDFPSLLEIFQEKRDKMKNLNEKKFEFLKRPFKVVENLMVL